MTELQTKRLAFLEETVNHFNVNNRGIDSKTNQCSYEAECAIGRHLDKQLANQFDHVIIDINEGPVSARVHNANVYSYLPLELQELGKTFLRYIQVLHDTKSNWNETGLSEKGKKEVEFIKKIFINS